MDIPIYNIWTVQMCNHALARGLGLTPLNITAKDGIKAFAPDMHLVMKYKRREIKKDRYTALYIQKMMESRIKYPQYWEALKRRPNIALMCYCSPNVYCHRHIFAILMEQYLKESGFVVQQHGEILPDDIITLDNHQRMTKYLEKLKLLPA